MRPHRIPAESRLLLWLAAALVPAPRRREWRMEWEGEIWWWMAAQPKAGRSLRERGALAAHCAGALQDGACLWLEREGRRPDWRGPRACLAAGLGLVALIAVSSGGFGDTRRSLDAMFRPRNAGLAILSETDPFMARQVALPPRKLAWWDRKSTDLAGTAIYSWYRSVAGAGRARATEVPAAKVGARFFALLGARPFLGRLFDEVDAASCRSCVVVAYDFWRGRLGADRGVVGRTITVDARGFRVIGVLRPDFWFLGQEAAVWSLDDEAAWRGIPVMASGAVARLRPGVKPGDTEAQLRTLARQVLPRESGTWVTVTPLDVILARPVSMLGPWLLGLLGLALAPAVPGLARRAWKPAAFLSAKAALFLGALFLASVEVGGGASLVGTAAFLVAGGVCLRWLWYDQRQRCPACLSRLMQPARIGEGSRMLLEPGGREMNCPRGHGLRFTPEGESMAPEDGWYPLDISAVGTSR